MTHTSALAALVRRLSTGLVLSLLLLGGSQPATAQVGLHGDIQFTDSTDFYSAKFRAAAPVGNGRVHFIERNAYDWYSISSGWPRTITLEGSLESPGNEVFLDIGANPSTNRIYLAIRSQVFPFAGRVGVQDGTTGSNIASVAVGDGPIALAVNSRTNRIYTANWYDATMSIVSGSSNAVTATVAVGTHPTDVAVNLLNGKAYVANFDSASVTIVNGSTGAVLATRSVGLNPIAIAVNPISNRAYVAQQGATTAVVIDGSTDGVLGSVLVGSGGVDVVVNPATNRVYFAVGGDQVVTVVDGATSSPTNYIDVSAWGTPKSLALDVSGDRLWVEMDAGGVEIDTRTNTVVSFTPAVDAPYALFPTCGLASHLEKRLIGSGSEIEFEQLQAGPTTWSSIGVGSAPVAVRVNPANGRAYVANNASNSVSVVDPLAGTVVATIAVGTAPIDVAVDAAAGRVFVANYGNGTVSVISTASNTVTATYGVGNGPKQIAVDPATGRAYTLNVLAGSLSAIDPVLATVITVPIPAVGPVRFAIDSANRQIAIACSSGNLVLISPSSYGALIVPVGAAPADVVVPPGTNRAWVANRDSNSVTTVNTSNGAVTGTHTNVGYAPYRMVVDPVHKRVYVAGEFVDSGRTTFDLVALDVNGAALVDQNTTSLTTKPIALDVDAATGRVYVVTNGGGGLHVFSPLLERESQLGIGSPFAVSVDPASGRAFAGYGSGTTLRVVDGRRRAALPLTTTIVPIAGNEAVDGTATISFTAATAYSPNNLSPQAVYFAVDTLEGPWAKATFNFISGDWYGTPSGLVAGAHVMFAYATDGMDGDGMQPGGRPIVGNLSAYPFRARPSCTATPLQITGQPQSATICAGDDLTLSATVAGTAPLALRWKKNGVLLSDGGNISGALSSSLTITSAQPADAGSYQLVAWDACAGSLASNTASVAVDAIPSEPGLLQLTKSGGSAVLTWSPSSSPGPSSVTYDVIRGSYLPDLTDTSFTKCVATGTNLTTVVDTLPDIWGPESVEYYLVRAKDACGPSRWGSSSIGDPIVARECP